MIWGWQTWCILNCSRFISFLFCAYLGQQCNTGVGIGTVQSAVVAAVVLAMWLGVSQGMLSIVLWYMCLYSICNRSSACVWNAGAIITLSSEICCHGVGWGKEQEAARVEPFCALLFKIQEPRKQLQGSVTSYRYWDYWHCQLDSRSCFEHWYYRCRLLHLTVVI